MAISSTLLLLALLALPRYCRSPNTGTIKITMSMVVVYPFPQLAMIVFRVLFIFLFHFVSSPCMRTVCVALEVDLNTPVLRHNRLSIAKLTLPMHAYSYPLQCRLFRSTAAATILYTFNVSVLLLLPWLYSVFRETPIIRAIKLVSISFYRWVMIAGNDLLIRWFTRCFNRIYANRRA